MKGLMKKIAVLLVTVLVTKLCAELSFGGLKFSVPENLAYKIVSFELGSTAPPVVEAEVTPTPTDSPNIIAESPNYAEQNPPNFEPPPSALPNDALIADGAEVQPVVAVTPAPYAGVPDDYAPKIENQTDAAIDALALLAEIPNISLSSGAPQILILHTHGSEAYSASDGYRTLDKTMNVVRVGDALTMELQNRGFNVVHDREMYDYPSYSGSYSRSGEAAAEWLKQYPSIQVVFDIHRDAAELADGTMYKSEYTPPNGASDTAQVMIIVTNGEKGLNHPNWQENMKLALDLQSVSDTRYPGLLRPLCISGQRYNEQLAPGYLLLEVGSSGNTVEEAAAAARLFADSAEITLKALIAE
ncbi:MAG: stage II sporulation protein P [Oscillospiraceae bacterium]|jgi:stage II sporulation protein P|nr:stage II sporulation protein P [Oscillospiraceae bacterium]